MLRLVSVSARSTQRPAKAFSSLTFMSLFIVKSPIRSNIYD